MPMTLYPAMDLLRGRRMRHGQPLPGPDAGPDAGLDAAGDDPLAVARGWKEAGASWLHVVDLDGALAGQPQHLDVVRALAEQTGLSLQVGGGLRTEADVAAVFAAGAARVVLEPAAGRNPELLAGCLARWDERIVVAVDARGGQLTVAGWLEILSEPALGFASRMASVGVRTLLVTNIAREETATSGDRVGLAALREALPVTRLIAAGDFASLDDIRWLAASGIDGAVLGRALADGTLGLAAALGAANGGAKPSDSTPPSPASTTERAGDGEAM
jgi:phosphoribosylformimino-5-aminoimidazole carboxamide ribotide isomerase